MKPSPSDTSERCGAAPAAWLAWSVAAVPAEREQLHAAVHAVVTAPPAAAPSLGVLVRPGQAVQGCAGCGQDTGRTRAAACAGPRGPVVQSTRLWGGSRMRCWAAPHCPLAGLGAGWGVKQPQNRVSRQ